MDALYRTQHDKKSLNWPIQELGHVIFHEFFKFPMDVCPKSSGGKHPTHLSGNHIYPLKNVLIMLLNWKLDSRKICHFYSIKVYVLHCLLLCAL